MPNIDVADEDAEVEVVGKVEIVDAAAGFGLVRVAVNVTAAEVDKPTEVLGGASLLLVLKRIARYLSVQFARTSHTT